MVQREQALSPSSFASFGPLLRYLRRRAQLTQRELAIAVGYSESYISRLEQGQRTPDGAALQALFIPALDLEYEPAWAARLLELAAAVPPGAGNASRPMSAEAAADAPQPVHLLATKLFMPRVRPGLVARPRLLSLLDQALELPLTLVAAPAGWGKSTLLTAWLSARMHDEGGRRPADANGAAWLSLDANDNDPATLLRYIIAALQHVAPTVGATTQALLQAPQAPPLATLLTPLINDLAAIPHDHILVLDDYHVVTAPAAHAMITFLLDNLPPQTHLIISSREDPPLPLARLRGRHELLELRAGELRFTSAEATAFLEQAMEVAISPDEVAVLEARTEGWIAGLQFAALALRGQSERADFIAAFHGSNRYVVDYLAAEVLGQLPGHLRRFVLQTAILERMCAPLCDAVIGLADHEPPAAGGADPARAGNADLGEGPGARNGPLAPAQQRWTADYSQHLLDELERRHLFIVPLDDVRQWYRYHHLFADVLRGHLKAGATPEAIAELHRRASGWLASHGLVAEAVSHALEAGDYQLAAALIEDAALDMTLSGQSSTLSDWLQALPTALPATRPRLYLALIWAAFGRAEFAAAGQYMQPLEDALAAMDAAGAGLLRAELAAARSIIFSYFDHQSAGELGRQALASLPTDYPAYGVVTVFYGIACYRHGRLDAAASALEHVIQLPQPALRMLVNRIGLLVVLASVRRMEGRLEAALSLAREAEQLATRGEQLFPSTATARSLLEAGAVLRERNRLEEAEAYLRRCIALSQQFAGRGYRIIAYLYLAQVAEARGDLDGAWALLMQAFDEMRAQHTWPANMRELEGYRILLAVARGDLATAGAWAASYRHTPVVAQAAMTPFDYDRLAFARTLMAEERWGAAQTSLAELERDAEAGGFGYFLIWTRCLQAVSYRMQGMHNQALSTLSCALAQAAPEGFVRVFVDQGAPMAALLHVARARGIAPGYATRLIESFPDAEREPGGPAVGPGGARVARDGAGQPDTLTERELSVLRLIAAGRSNQAIGRQLFITVGTVKRHVNSILGKLDAQSRTHAVARAREHGLLE